MGWCLLVPLSLAGGSEAEPLGTAYWVVPWGATQSGCYQIQKAVQWFLWGLWWSK